MPQLPQTEGGSLTNASLAVINAEFASLDAIAGLVATSQVVFHATYNNAVDGGAVGLITPAVNFTLPTNFVIQNVALNSTTAVLAAAGAATVSVGLSAGGAGAAALVAATAKASWGANAFVQGIPVPQTANTWIKMSAPGTVTLTVATNPLTAGVIEIYVFGYQSAS